MVPYAWLVFPMLVIEMQMVSPTSRIAHIAIHRIFVCPLRWLCMFIAAFRAAVLIACGAPCRAAAPAAGQAMYDGGDAVARCGAFGASASSFVYQFLSGLCYHLHTGRIAHSAHISLCAYAATHDAQALPCRQQCCLICQVFDDALAPGVVLRSITPCVGNDTRCAKSRRAAPLSISVWL